MKLENLSDKDLAEFASNIEIENKRRASRKAAATAILIVLKKHGLSIDDLPRLAFENQPALKKRGRQITKKKATARAKTKNAKKTDKRTKVAYKYRNSEGPEKWSGRGRTPKWVSAILENKRISISQFKDDSRFKF